MATREWPPTERKRGRTAKACTHCRATKTRCAFSPGAITCDKCAQRGLVCSMLPPGQLVSVARDRMAQRSHARTGSRARAVPDPPQPGSAPTPVATNNQAEKLADSVSPTSDHSRRDSQVTADISPLSAGWPSASATPTIPPLSADSSPQWSHPRRMSISRPESDSSAVAGNLHTQFNGATHKPHSQSVHSIPAFASSMELSFAPPMTSTSVPVSDNGFRHTSISGMSHREHQHQALSQQHQQQQRHQPENMFTQPQEQQQFQQQFRAGRQSMPVLLNGSSSAFDNSLSYHSNGTQTYTTNGSQVQQHMQSDIDPRPMSISESIHQSASRAIRPDSVSPQRLSELVSPFHQDFPPMDFRAIMDLDAFADPNVTSVDPANVLANVPFDTDNYFNDSAMMFFDDLETINKDDHPTEDAATRPGDLLSIGKTRFRLQNSATFLTLQSIDAISRLHLGQASKLLRAQPRVTTRHLLTIGLLAREQVLTLMNLFLKNFNHWIGLPTELSLDELLDMLLSKCPFLVTACCCVAMRLCEREEWERYYPVLVNFLNAEFAATLLESPQNLQFVQAITIVSLYSDSLTYDEYVFDEWYLSGLGIQQLTTLASLTNSFTHVHLRLWNHLCMVNLSSSVMTGRHAVVAKLGLSVARRILLEPQLDRFDSCIIAEITVYQIAFQYFSYQSSFEEFERQIMEWQKEWTFLIDFSLVQFVEPIFSLLYFLARWNHMWRQAHATGANRQMASLSPSLARNEEGAPEEEVYDPLSETVAKSMTTSQLISDLATLNSVVTAVLDTVHELYFGRLSDKTHDIAFIASIMGFKLRKLILNRDETLGQTERTLKETLHLARRFAERLQFASRGQDMERVQCYAIVKLLQDEAEASSAGS